jgi:ubiquinone/menaquinone biosynthesis C-methylase UbiE
MSVDYTHLKDSIKQRWNQRANSFDNSPGHGIRSEKEKREWINLFTRVIGKNRLDILDVGSGTGVISLVLADMGHNITGLDIAEEMVKTARDKFIQHGLSGNFIVGDAEKPPFEDSSFDIVINRHVVWSLLQPEKAMKEWKRVLKPGGKLIIIDGKRDKKIPFNKKLWRFGAQFLILITEMRNPWQNRAQNRFEKYMPMRQQKRPKADIEILEGLGMHVDVMKLEIPRWEGYIGYLKYGYINNEEFFITAVKPKSNA